MGSNEPPSWIADLLSQQTQALSNAMTNVLQKELLKFTEPGEDETQAPPSKRPRVESEAPSTTPSDTENAPLDDDDDDDFVRKYGKIFKKDVTNPNENQMIGDSELADKDSDHESECSVDDDMVDIQENVPNWDTSSSIKKFVENNIDRPLSDAVLTELDSDHTPEKDLQDLLQPPKMPKPLITMLTNMKSKGALRTEKALYNSQKELFIVAKTLLSAFIELRPLGKIVAKAREILSVTLRGFFSVSLGITKSRRENVRFLFSDQSVATSLYSYEPNSQSIFGGKDFVSQLEKANKESKIITLLDKKNNKGKFFRGKSTTGFSKGFQYSKGASKYFGRAGSTGYRRGGNNYSKKHSNRGRGNGPSRTKE